MSGVRVSHHPPPQHWKTDTWKEAPTSLCSKVCGTTCNISLIERGDLAHNADLLFYANRTASMGPVGEASSRFPLRLARPPSAPQPPPRPAPSRPISSASRRAQIRAGVILGWLPQEMMRMNSIQARALGVRSSQDPDGALGGAKVVSSMSRPVMRSGPTVPADPPVLAHERSGQMSSAEDPPERSARASGQTRGAVVGSVANLGQPAALTRNTHPS